MMPTSQVSLYQAQVADLRSERDALKEEVAALQAESSRKEKKLKGELERVRKQVCILV
jgi:outer membrane murein-binding lipoprotein Lpp